MTHTAFYRQESWIPALDGKAGDPALVEKRLAKFIRS